MAVYLVSYHLMMEQHDYRRLHEALHSVPHYHTSQSVWLIEHPGDAGAIRDWLARFIDSDDRLLVSQVTTDWAAMNIGRHADWLNQRIA